MLNKTERVGEMRQNRRDRVIKQMNQRKKERRSTVNEHTFRGCWSLKHWKHNQFFLSFPVGYEIKIIPTVQPCVRRIIEPDQLVTLTSHTLFLYKYVFMQSFACLPR